LRTESFSFEGTEVQYLRAGQGRPLLLLHGSGPGASSIGNWKAVMAGRRIGVATVDAQAGSDASA
jgi:2-hydroxymuconate-semialdehyde hydrolase